VDQELHYGGQAVIEGVMMRGRTHMAIAVRQPDGEIATRTERLPPRVYQGPWSRIPFLRGMVLLWDALVLGMRALLYSAEVATGEEEVQFEGPLAWGTIAFSFVLAIGIFFLLPLLLVSLADRHIESPLLSNFVEGLIRLGFLVAYIRLVSLIPDIRRVFRYHGAEHKTIHAYEAGAPLEPEQVQQFATAHPRCGTAFLLGVAALAIVVFSVLGRPPLWIRILTRILFIPVISGLSYELLKVADRHRSNWLLRTFWLRPGLALQRLTTGEPDDGMVEVAVAALRELLRLESSLA
jgi:uncharacterized protein YqhQ